MSLEDKVNLLHEDDIIAKALDRMGENADDLMLYDFFGSDVVDECSEKEKHDAVLALSFRCYAITKEMNNVEYHYFVSYVVKIVPREVGGIIQASRTRSEYQYGSAIVQMREKIVDAETLRDAATYLGKTYTPPEGFRRVEINILSINLINTKGVA
jgi:hypothetical protein